MKLLESVLIFLLHFIRYSLWPHFAQSTFWTQSVITTSHKYRERRHIVKISSFLVSRLFTFQWSRRARFPWVMTLNNIYVVFKFNFVSALVAIRLTHKAAGRREEHQRRDRMDSRAVNLSAASSGSYMEAFSLFPSDAPLYEDVCECVPTPSLFPSWGQ